MYVSGSGFGQTGPYVRLELSLSLAHAPIIALFTSYRARSACALCALCRFLSISYLFFFPLLFSSISLLLLPPSPAFLPLVIFLCPPSKIAPTNTMHRSHLIRFRHPRAQTRLNLQQQANRRIYDPVIQSYSGMACENGTDGKKSPSLVLQFFFDKITALTCCQAALAALYHRDRTGGNGQFISCAMLDVALYNMWPDLYVR